MLKRTITSVIALPVLALFIITGGLPLKIFVFAIIAIGLYEIYNALSGKKLNIHYIGFLFSAIYIFFIDDLYDTNIMAILSILFTLCVLTLLVIFHRKITVVECAQAIFGFYYVAVLMSTIYLVRMSSHGDVFVWLIFITAWGSDTGAYLTGNFIGKNKLIPSLSPNKTVEGSVGGVVMSTALSIIYGFVLMYFFESNDPVQLLVFGVVGILGGIFSQFGDLTASAIKRHTKIKDFGSLLPGHGGIIDRFDSVLFTSPAVFLVILLMVR